MPQLRPPTFSELMRMQCPAIKALLPQFSGDPIFLINAKRRARRGQSQAATELEIDIDRLLALLGNPLPQPKPPRQHSWRWIGVAVTALGAVALGVGHGIGQDVWHELRPRLEGMLTSKALPGTSIGPIGK